MDLKLLDYILYLLHIFCIKDNTMKVSNILLVTHIYVYYCWDMQACNDYVVGIGDI